MFQGIYFASSLVQLLLAVYVFKKGSRNFSYLLFFGLSLSTWCWGLLSYLSVTVAASSYLIYLVRGVMCFALLQTWLFYLFARQYPQPQWIRGTKELIYFQVFAIVALVFTASPLLFRSVSVRSGVVNMQYGWEIILFILFTSLAIGQAFRLLIGKYRRTAGMQRMQLAILLLAGVIYWIITPITNFGVTLIFKTTLFVELSPLFSLSFSCLIGYAILRHYMFDFRKMLFSSVIYVEYYFRDRQPRAIQFYELLTLVERANSNNIALDFSGLQNLDKEAVQLLTNLDGYLRSDGTRLYYTGLTQKVFEQLRGAHLVRFGTSGL